MLPVVFLLNPAWKLWWVVIFNGSIIFLTIWLQITHQDSSGQYTVASDLASFLHQLNLGVTATVILVVMIHFSSTIGKKDEALTQANLELEKQNKAISKQHQHLQILIKEIHHRVKNNLQIISSLMSLQREAADESVVEVLNESRRRVEAIALIHQKLYQDDQANHVDFKSYLEELLATQQIMTPHVKCQVVSDEAILNLDLAVPLGLIISELITNAVKHAYVGIDQPELYVNLIAGPIPNFELIIYDNGIGLPKEFSIEEPESLGFEIIILLAEQIDAKIDFENKNGARFMLHFRA